MKQDSLINTLFYSKNPLKGLNKIHAYYTIGRMTIVM